MLLIETKKTHKNITELLSYVLATTTWIGLVKGHDVA